MNNDSRSPIILWFRRDLRVDDNPALCFACEQNQPIVPVYIWSPEEDGVWQMGEASRWWLHQSLEKLNKSISGLARAPQPSLLPLVIRVGQSSVVLSRLIVATRASAICWNRLYEPVIYGRDRLIERQLQSKGILVKTFKTGLLYEPWEIKTKSNTPFKVFTPFWKKSLQCVSLSPPRLRPSQIQLSPQKFQPLTVKSLELLSNINWYANIQKHWHPGEVTAKQKLDMLLDSTLLEYDKSRDFPELIGTSLLSPHLHFGEISPKQIWHAVIQKEKTKDINDLSTGGSAAPYYQIFNPILQGTKFDAGGNYLRQYLPEIARLPNEYSHQPWLAPSALLNNLGIELGRTYPEPVVVHSFARKRALRVYTDFRNGK